jgi:hypothetical protein
VHSRSLFSHQAGNQGSFEACPRTTQTCINHRTSPALAVGHYLHLSLQPWDTLLFHAAPSRLWDPRAPTGTWWPPLP